MESTASNYPGYFTQSDGGNGKAHEASFAAARSEHVSSLASQTAARDIVDTVSYNSKDNVVVLLDKHYHAQLETQRGFRELERQIAQNREMTLALQLDSKNAEIRTLDRATAASTNDSILALLKTLANKG